MIMTKLTAREREAIRYDALLTWMGTAGLYDEAHQLALLEQALAESTTAAERAFLQAAKTYCRWLWSSDKEDRLVATLTRAHIKE